MYKRIILKLSGETLAPEKPEGAKSPTFDALRVEEVARVIAELAGMGVQVGVVMGGGNIWRGRFSEEMNAVNADQMGMLATVINALAVEDALCRLGREGHRVHRAGDEPLRPPLHGQGRHRVHGKRRDRPPCRRHGQPLLYHGYGRGAARGGTEGRRGLQGHHRGGRLRQRPAQEPGRAAHPRHQLPRGRHPRPARHGPDRLHALHGAEGAGGARVLHGEPRQHPPRGRGGGSGHHRTRIYAFAGLSLAGAPRAVAGKGMGACAPPFQSRASRDRRKPMDEIRILAIRRSLPASKRGISAMLRCLSPRRRSGRGDHFARRRSGAGDGRGAGGQRAPGARGRLGRAPHPRALWPGRVFAEAYACVEGEPLLIDVVAASDCNMLFLDAARVLRPCPNACAFHARLVRNLLTEMAKKEPAALAQASASSRRTPSASAC